MKILYILLTPTFGMHQYTAHYANRFAAGAGAVSSRQSPVPGLRSPIPSLLTTAGYPKSRYSPDIPVTTPICSGNSGIEPYTLNAAALRNVLDGILEMEPDLVHFTGPHLWNVLLLRALRRHGIPTVHTIHDLDPHHGENYGRLLHLWNHLIIRYAGVILLHGKCYHRRLLERGVPARRLAYAPLLHLFLGHDTQSKLENGRPPHSTHHTPHSTLNFLFFGRLLPYKGLDDLLDAWTLVQNGHAPQATLTIAGPGDAPANLQRCTPADVHLRNGLIDDQTALSLFRDTDLVLLPYHDATQSALIAAAYHFKKPVLVTQTGALPEYVQHQETGYIVDPRDPQAIAAALKQAMQNPDHLRRMGQNGHAWYQTQRAHEQKTIQTLYHSLLNHNHHTHNPP